MTDDDVTLRRLIGRADPASALREFRGDQLVRLAEDAMHTTTPTAPARRRRSWLFAGAGVVAAAAVVLVVAPLVIGAGGGAAPGGVTALTQPAAGGPAAACAPVTAEAIAGYDTAFRAEVTGIEGDTVTLSVTERFHGDVGDAVTTSQGTGDAVDGAPLRFVAGETYLVAAREGWIVTCGVSGPVSPELDALYQQAFDR